MKVMYIMYIQALKELQQHSDFAKCHFKLGHLNYSYLKIHKYKNIFRNFNNKEYVKYCKFVYKMCDIFLKNHFFKCIKCNSLTNILNNKKITGFKNVLKTNYKEDGTIGVF